MKIMQESKTQDERSLKEETWRSKETGYGGAPDVSAVHRIRHKIGIVLEPEKELEYWVHYTPARAIIFMRFQWQMMIVLLPFF
jgi:hypothetical protein